MRDAYHDELDSIGEGLVDMTRLVGSAIGHATRAVHRGNPASRGAQASVRR